MITEVNSSGGWDRGGVFAGGKHIATYAARTTYFTHADWIGAAPMLSKTRSGPRCQNRTERVRTGVSGAVVESCTSLPEACPERSRRGDSQSCSGSDPSPLHFAPSASRANLGDTGKQRDTETGLDAPFASRTGLRDDFNARYYASTAGRFMSPDWSAKPQCYDLLPGACPERSRRAQLADPPRFFHQPGAVRIVRIGPQSLNLYVYVRDNPITGLDIDGHSWLLYDGRAHKVTLISNKGLVVGSWTAYNNVAAQYHGHLTSGPMTNGLHAIQPEDRGGATKHLGGSVNSAYGQNGIIHVENYTGILGNMVKGAGLHAGRADAKDKAGREGPQHCTFACTRTTDNAMAAINSWAKTDPLTVLFVTNNEQNINNWLKKVHRHRNTTFDEIVPRISATLQPPK